MSIFDYISKYGDYSFLDKGFNEVDNVILSVLSYVDFDGIKGMSNSFFKNSFLFFP